MGNDWTDRVSSIVGALRSLRGSSVTIDGEAVVCDRRGVTDFDALRSALARRQGARDVLLFALDVIRLDGQDLRREPWTARKTPWAAQQRTRPQPERT
jgi:bifunctional non-homologous end joining protein LigD